MRMVVYGDEGAAIARHTTDEPLGASSIDGPVSMSFLDDSRHVTSVQVALGESRGRVFRPDKTNDLRIA